MSEAARTYSGSGRGQRRGDRKGSRRVLRLALLAVFVVAASHAWWISRDTHRIEHFVPADQPVQVVLLDPLAKRDRVAASHVWEAMPPFTGLHRVPEALGEASGAPEWLLNNLVGSVCHLSAGNARDLSELLFVTRMTRIGVWAERLNRLRGGVVRDAAGGLNLRKLHDQDLYYAVRGRTLVVSPSRTALIHALTLTAERALAPGYIAETVRAKGGEDLSGTIVFSEQDPLGRAFRSMSFAVLVQEDSLRLVFRGAPADVWRRRLDAVPDLGPRPLLMPPDGMIAAAVNFGTPVRELWALLGEMGAPFTREQWDEWAALQDDEAPGLAHFLTNLTGDLGPGIGFSLRRVDLNAIIPMPEAALIFEASDDDIARAYAALPPMPEGNRLLQEGWPRHDPETRRVWFPMMDGPTLEPTAAPYGPGLLLSNSRTLAEEILAVDPPAAAPAAEGNLYLRMHPEQCAAAVAGVGRLLTESGMLRGYDEASFEEAASEWQALAARVGQVVLTAGWQDGEVNGELRIETSGR